MHLEIRTRNVDADGALQGYIRQRLSQALDHMERRIANLTVRLHDANGPRGGVDKECLLLAEVRSLGQMVAHAEADDIQAAVDHAAHRLERMIRRRLERQRTANFSGRVSTLLPYDRGNGPGEKNVNDRPWTDRVGGLHLNKY